ncbi:hypothetical protein BGZ74_007932 [Mortierella antarctica]|nr:hypothetical protein BGZ74_007932 [Mortierella antarctica]
MKIAFVSLAALVSVAMAAPGTPEVSEATRSKFDGNSKYSISGFRPSFSKIDECCLRNAGGYDFDMEESTLHRPRQQTSPTTATSTTALPTTSSPMTVSPRLHRPRLLCP